MLQASTLHNKVGLFDTLKLFLEKSTFFGHYCCYRICYKYLHLKPNILTLTLKSVYLVSKTLKYNLTTFITVDKKDNISSREMKPGSTKIRRILQF